MATILENGQQQKQINLCAWHSDQNCSIHPWLQISSKNETIASIWNETKKIHMHGPPLYRCHWHAWVRWVIEQDLDPLSPTVIDLAENFLALVKERKQSSDSENSLSGHFHHS